MKRLNDIKHAIQPLKSIEDIKDIMKLAREKTLVAIPEGKDLLIYLFSLSEQWIMVYNSINVIYLITPIIFNITFYNIYYYY